MSGQVFGWRVIGFSMTRQLHTRCRNVHTMLCLAGLSSTLFPQLVKGGPRGDLGVWLNPAHTNSMNKLDNLPVLPFGGDEAGFGLGCKREWQKLLLTSEVVHIGL